MKLTLISKLFPLIVLASSSLLYAQTPKVAAFNLAPQEVLQGKEFEVIDYSYKLDYSEAKQPVQKNFLKKFTNEETATMEVKHPEHFAYYQKALKYFNALSSRVKSIYTTEELWYIYKFDQKLKTKLTKIN